MKLGESKNFSLYSFFVLSGYDIQPVVEIECYPPSNQRTSYIYYSLLCKNGIVNVTKRNENNSFTKKEESKTRILSMPTFISKYGKLDFFWDRFAEKYFVIKFHDSSFGKYFCATRIHKQYLKFLSGRRCYWHFYSSTDALKYFIIQTVDNCFNGRRHCAWIFHEVTLLKGFVLKTFWLQFLCFQASCSVHMLKAEWHFKK